MNEARLMMKRHDLIHKKLELLTEVEDNQNLFSQNSLDILREYANLVEAQQDLLEEVLKND